MNQKPRDFDVAKKSTPTNGGASGDPRALLWKRIAIVVLAVVGIAAVIFVSSLFSSPKSSETPEQSAPSKQQMARKLADQAESAASREDTATAIDLAQRALALDASNEQAQTIIDDLSSPTSSNTGSNGTSGDTGGGSSSGNESDTGGDKPAPSPDAYTKGVDPITDLLPAKIVGWTRGQVVDTKSDALVTYDPPVGANSPTVRVVVYVHDRGTSAKAKQFIEKVSKSVYPEDAKAIPVGVAKSYFGTDGTRLAALSFARGRYAFEVVATTQQGFAADSRADTVKIAGALPATRK